MSAKVIFELCSATLDACIAARDGGADRIELCSALSEGGLTPSHGFIRAAVEQSGLPVHVLIRPRSDDFIYCDAEIELMREDIVHARESGAAGVVLGVLAPKGTVDVEKTKRLIEAASSLQVTFHRAFDAIAFELHEESLEQIIAMGCSRLLTSGGKPDVMQGAAELHRLHELSAGRIAIAAGGGLRLENAAAFVRQTGLQQIHGSLRRHVVREGRDGYIVDAEDIKLLRRSLDAL